MSISNYLPGLSCSVSWNPADGCISYDYNEHIRITLRMPKNFTKDDFLKVLEIKRNWRQWRSHTAKLSFDPSEYGITAAETPVEAIHYFLNSFDVIRM